MALAPIDFGGPVQADLSGVDTLRAAVAGREAIFEEARKLGGNIESGAHVIMQGLLHTQALKATAAVKERQASTLSFIESNPYVPKAVLQQRMSPDDYQAWHAGLATEYQDKRQVPMFTAAGALFDSEAQQAREQAGAVIALPGWREKWAATEQSESATIRERYVNRMAADQLVADQRAQTLTHIDSMVDNAMNPHDLEAAAVAAETSPWLAPAARRITAQKVRIAKDSFVAEHAMLAGDVNVMKSQLDKLKSKDAAAEFPDMDEHHRLDLMQRLERQYGYHAAKSVGNDIVTANVDVHTGKVNRTGIAQALAAYKGTNKDEVVKATQAQEHEALNVFDAQSSEVQDKVFTAGQDPRTGEFSMSRAQANPAAAKAADWLNKNAPGKLGALSDRDLRLQRISDAMDRQAAREEKLRQIAASHDNLESIRSLIHDETQADSLRKMTPSQFNSQLHDVAGGLTDEDMDKARKEFDAFQKRGGKSDERATVIVDAEIKAAANGDASLMKKLSAKYRDQLLRAAHDSLRDNGALEPMALSEKVHEDVKAHMVRGSVVGGGVWGDRGARYAEWESNLDFAGKDFKLEDGTVISHVKQPAVRLTKGNVTMDFRPEKAAEARADGWK